MGPERKIESHLCKCVSKAGGLCVKIAPTVAGVPDRLVVLNGNMYLIELKSPRGYLRPVQVEYHKRCLKTGVTVLVLNTIESVDDWMSGLDY